jgi:hypothetical protein
VEARASQLEAVRRRHQRRQLRVLSGCIAGSLVVHLFGWAWVASMREPIRRPAPGGYMVIERWPAPAPPVSPAPAEKAGGSERSPATPRSVRAATPASAGEVQRKGFLRALESVGKEQIAKGLPGTLVAADAPSGLPDAPGAGPAPAVPAAAPAPRPAGGPGGFGTGVGSGGGGTGGGTGTGVGLGAGTVDSAEIDRARLESFVRTRIGGLRACYEAELRLDSRRGGTVRVRFVIRTTGEVSDVVVARDEFESMAMADCLARILRTWSTPFRPSVAVPVEVPFVFRPVAG